ncbi:MAG: GTPase [Ignisphaera sp.]|nr:GTPase [Ignisphaera sp.]
MVRKVVIIGAGGRDFHNFNMVFRNNPEFRVVAFVVTQIPGLEYNRYPASLAGELYPDGIPILPLSELPNIVARYGVDEVILSFSDLTYQELGRIVSLVLSLGVDFRILGPRSTMLESIKPVLAVTAVKTGAGKSAISRAFALEITRRGLKVAVVRHPMAYGELAKKSVMVIKSFEDMQRYDLTVEEREEVEPHLKLGLPVLLGVDYGKILLEAEKIGDVILWDGGNNDWPFFRPHYMVVAADAMRPGLEVSAYPGEVNVRMADAVIITKVSQASKENIEKIVRNVREINSRAHIVKADLDVELVEPVSIAGKKVVVVEDSPTVTHGGAPYGAGYVAAQKYGAVVVDPKPYAVGIIRKIYDKYPHMGPVVPSTGYTPEQLRDLEETLNRINADIIINASPSNLVALLKLNKPVVNVTWSLKVVEGPTVKEMVDEFLAKAGRK